MCFKSELSCFSSGKSLVTSMELTQQAVTMATVTFSWTELMFIITKPQVSGNLMHLVMFVHFMI